MPWKQMVPSPCFSFTRVASCDQRAINWVTSSSWSKGKSFVIGRRNGFLLAQQSEHAHLLAAVSLLQQKQSENTVKDKVSRTTPFGTPWLMVLAAAWIFIGIPYSSQSLLLVFFLWTHSQLNALVTRSRELLWTEVILSTLVTVS